MSCGCGRPPFRVVGRTGPSAQRDRLLPGLSFVSYRLRVPRGRRLPEGPGACIDALAAQVLEDIADRFPLRDECEYLHLPATGRTAERHMKDALQELLPLTLPAGGKRPLPDHPGFHFLRRPPGSPRAARVVTVVADQPFMMPGDMRGQPRDELPHPDPFRSLPMVVGRGIRV